MERVSVEAREERKQAEVARYIDEEDMVRKA